MKQLFLPEDYTSVLDVWQTEHAIKFIKDTFQLALAAELKLRRITAPIVVPSGKGLNDNLSGTEQPVSFGARVLGGQRAEIVQSLAKWKRYALWRHHIQPGMGIYTDMNALRPDETIDNIHSVYVDQWDWEKVITPEERTPERLQLCVERIYAALKRTEFLLSEQFPVLQPFLPDRIHFIHAEELRKQYPGLSPKEREERIACQFGAVFIRGIGGALGDGTIHDDRSPDYDDWSTEAEDGSEPCITVCFRDFFDGDPGGSGCLGKTIVAEKCRGPEKIVFPLSFVGREIPPNNGGRNRTIPALYALIAEMSYRRGTSRLMAR